MTRLVAALAFLCLFGAAAHASPRQAPQGLQYCSQDGTYRHSCGQADRRIQRLARVTGEGVIGRRPPGCPHRYCGCEASLYKFGRIIPELNLAANWIRKFPRTSPAPGMAAARSGHVMVLISHVEGSDWLVHDGNSGGGLTRRHVRSIKRYVVVNPDATRVASHD